MTRMILVVALICFSLISSPEPAEAQDSTITNAVIEVVPTHALSGLDTIPANPMDLGIPLTAFVLNHAGGLLTDLGGVPIIIPVTFRIIEQPIGATGMVLHPEGLDSIVVDSNEFGFAQVYFDMGDLPGIYRVEATSPYSTENHIFTLITGDFPVHIEVIASSPVWADSVDVSVVDIFVTDRDGLPVSNANLAATRTMGFDIKVTYPVTNMGAGYYIASVPSDVADTALVLVTDTITYAEGQAPVVYQKTAQTGIYIHQSDILYMPYSVGQDQYYIFECYAHDARGNKYTCPAEFAPSFYSSIGNIDSVWCEGGFAKARVRADTIGSGYFYAEDGVSGLADSVDFAFYPLVCRAPEGAVGWGDTISIAVDAYLADPLDTLGLYDLNFTFNSSALIFLGAADGDETDGFAAPAITMVNDSTINLTQTNTGNGGGESSGEVNLVDLSFATYAYFGMRGQVGPGLLGLKTTDNKDLPTAPAKKTEKKVKEIKYLHLKIFVEKGSGVTKEEIEKDIAHAQEVFDAASDSCCAIKIKWDGKIDTFKTSDYDVDKADGELDDYADTKLTKEEKALIEATKDKRDKNKANVYYMKKDLKGAYGQSVNKKSFGESKSSVMMGPGARHYNSKHDKKQKKDSKDPAKPLRKGLAHELSHLLGDGDVPDVPGKGTDKLMEYNSKAPKEDKKGDSGTKLTKKECKKIMNSGLLKGS